MDIATLVSYFLHIDVHLASLIESYHAWVYAILFMIIFAETGLVFMPLLPGDSLLFAAGTFAAIGSFNVYFLFVLLFIAAVLGDSLNYSIGRHFGRKLFVGEYKYWLNKNHLALTEGFYHRHGGKTIIIARFIPIIRTFAPFVAGIGHMKYMRFILYNVVGAFAWVGLFVFGGYFFGTLPFVQDNLSLIIIGIILASFLPVIWHFVKRLLFHKL